MNSVMELKLKDIVPSKFNTRKRFDDKKMADLVLSIKEKGVIQPIIVRKHVHGHEIVCGERRYRASEKAGKTTIPALVRELTDNQVVEFQVIENLQREDVHPLEEAEGYEALLKNHGYKTVDDIAAKVGKSRTYIYGRLKLCELISENRKLFYDDKFSASVALLVARIPAALQKQASKKLLDRVDRGDIVSYREAHRCIERDFMLQLKEAPFDPKDATLGSKRAGPCTTCNKRTGNQKELFPDISSADVCTDPLCFNMKKNAFIQMALARAQEAGKKVLSIDECKKIFPREYDTSPEKGYVALDDTCYDDFKRRKFSQLIQGLKDVDIIYAVHPHKMKLIQLLSKTEVSRIIKKLGVKSSGEAGTNKYRVEQANARRAEVLRKATRARLVSDIIKKAMSDDKKTYLRTLAESVLDHACFDTQRTFIQQRDKSIKQDKVYSAIKEYLEGIDDSVLLPFCLDILICNGGSPWGDKYGPTTRKLCKHYNIDIKAIEVAVKKDIESKKKAEVSKDIKK